MLKVSQDSRSQHGRFIERSQITPNTPPLPPKKQSLTQHAHCNDVVNNALYIKGAQFLFLKRVPHGLPARNGEI